MDDNEKLSRKELCDIQLSRLQIMVDYCYNNVPFYRERLGKAGITSGSQIKTLSDIDKIPFTTKEDLNDNYPYGFLAVDMSEIVRIHASSGTTGNPKLAFYTENDLKLWKNLSARVLKQNGLLKDDIFQISVGYGLFTGALGFHYGAEEVGAAIIPASVGNTQKQLKMLEDLGVTAFMATPSYATYISELIKNIDPEHKKFKLKKILLGAERATDNMRKIIEENTGIETRDNYGLTECFGPGVAGECEAREGMHISEDYFYPEIINPDTGNVLKNGERGELVFTSLLKEGMPLLRYRTRDITSLNYEKCKCGRTTVRMDYPYATVDDMIVFKGVNIYPSQIENIIDRIDELTHQYKIILNRENYVDSAKLIVELKNKYSYYSENKLNSIKEKLDFEMKKDIIVKIETEIIGNGTFERSYGKTKRVEDNRYL